MKFSRYSPSRASMICSSWPVPSVATTSAWVSPRVNSEEPWARGSTPTSATIGRTVLVSRASRRLPGARKGPPTALGPGRSHGFGVAAVDALAGVENGAAHDVGLEVAELLAEHGQCGLVAL